MLLKVCGMVNAENISALVDLKPDFMGFIFYKKSPRFVTNLPTVSIPKSIQKVGVFVNETPQNIIKLVAKNKLNAVQLHGNETALYCEDLLQAFKNIKKEISIIKAFSVNENFNFSKTLPYVNSCTYFLFDTKTEKHGGSGKKFNWNLLAKYTYKTPFFLSGGLQVEDAKTINSLKYKQLVGVDINSQFETSPGLKNIESITEFKTNLQ